MSSVFEKAHVIDGAGLRKVLVLLKSKIDEMKMDTSNYLMSKFYAGDIPYEREVSGSETLTLDDIQKVMKITLAGDTTITLPEPENLTLDFKISVQQDSTSSRNLSFESENGANVYDINNANFATGTANQKCLVALSWDGVDWWMSTSDYFNA